MKTLCAILFILASTPVFAQTTVPDGFTFAAAGDLIGPYAAFNVDSTSGIPALAALFRHADLGFV